MADKRQPLLVDLHIPYGTRGWFDFEELFDTEDITPSSPALSGDAQKDAYMAALRRELLSWEGELADYEVQALRVSGPCATAVKPDLLGDLLRTAREILPMAHGAEVSVNAGPATVGTPALTGIAAGRPNRMELIMRSGSDEELLTLGCGHTVQQVNNAVLFFHRFHVNNFGLTVDLGIPGQTQASFRNTLHACTIIRPAHIRMQMPSLSESGVLEDKEELFALYRQGCAFLKENGYLQYEAASFCLPQHACRFTLAEMDGTAFLGLGLAGVSLFEGYLTQNTNSLSVYLAYAGDYEKVTSRVYTMDPEAVMKHYTAQRLRAPGGLSQAAFGARFGQSPPESLYAELSEQIGKGLLAKVGTDFIPTEKGLFSVLQESRI